MNKIRRKFLIFGGQGQLGRALLKQKPLDTDLYSFSKKEIDITSPADTEKVILEIKPDWIINAAAYTKVDNAESNRKIAFKINCEGVKNIAIAAMKVNAKMVHVSTDYVFDGQSSLPYKPDDLTNPINIYGESKLAGEEQALDIMANNLLLLRTAWVYSIEGPSFLTTMIKLLHQKEEIAVVDDQFGSPTSARSLAEMIFTAINNDIRGIYHWTNAGIASWYDFSSAIRQIILSNNPNLKIASIRPVNTSQYKASAKRANYCILDKDKIRNKLKLPPLHWRDELFNEMGFNKSERLDR